MLGPRPAKPTHEPPFHGHDWNRPTDKVICNRIKRHRDGLSKILGLHGKCDEEKIDQVVTDLSDVLFRSWLWLRDVDAGASDAGQRQILASLAELNDTALKEAIEHIDPATWNRIAQQYVNPLDAWRNGFRVDRVRPAIASALKNVGPTQSGRPRGSGSLARYQLALGLAYVFNRATGEEPTVRYREIRQQAYGPFLDFCAFVVSRLPRPLFMPKNRDRGPVHKGVTDLARAGSRMFKKGAKSPNFPNRYALDTEFHFENDPS